MIECLARLPEEDCTLIGVHQLVRVQGFQSLGSLRQAIGGLRQRLGNTGQGRLRGLFDDAGVSRIKSRRWRASRPVSRPSGGPKS